MLQINNISLIIGDRKILNEVSFQAGHKDKIGLVGRNGAGKSSIGMALGILQKIARGDNRIRDLITPEDMTRGHDDIPVRFE